MRIRTFVFGQNQSLKINKQSNIIHEWFKYSNVVKAAKGTSPVYDKMYILRIVCQNYSWYRTIITGISAHKGQHNWKLPYLSRHFFTIEITEGLFLVVENTFCAF